MNNEEHAQFTLLREEVKKDIQLAIANFKIWLLLTVLSNVILIGVPALYVFFSTTNTAQTALTMALEDRRRIDDRRPFMTQTDARLTSIERHLQERDNFAPLPTQNLPQ